MQRQGGKRECPIQGTESTVGQLGWNKEREGSRDEK